MYFKNLGYDWKSPHSRDLMQTDKVKGEHDFVLTRILIALVLPTRYLSILCIDK